MRKPITAFHYLTQDFADRSHEEQVRIACEAGVRWIQLRVKDKKYEDWLKVAMDVKQITNKFRATLIINDSVKIAKEAEADGVHLGQEDGSIEEARKILGEEKIIGYSTHSFEDLSAAKNLDVDYFGLGPFRFTSTKENLHPVLGLEGIKKIIHQARVAGITKQIIAIGGIQLSDVKEILKAGADGIAISSAINLSVNPIGETKMFLQQISNRKLQTEV